MKLLNLRLQRLAGIALPEVLIGVAVASIILGGLLAGSIALQSSFSASDRLARAQADLQRVADYMARDIRNATSIDATATSTVLLSLTAADYFDRRGTADSADDVANSPSLGRTGATYGANPVTIRYLKSGTQILRQVTRIDAGASTAATTPIADRVDNLTVAFAADGTATITAAAPMDYARRPAGTSVRTLSYVIAAQSRN